MNRLIIDAGVIALGVLMAALWRIDNVTAGRDALAVSLTASEARAESLRTTLRISRELLTERDALDARHTQELTHALETNDALRRDVADGRKRLRVKASCPSRVPANASAPGVDDADAAELTADARQDYFTLVDQLALSRQMVAGLQDYVTRACLKQSQTP